MYLADVFTVAANLAGLPGISVTCGFSAARLPIGLQFIVNRPPNEPGFRLDRQEANDRVIRYTMFPYATEKPHGERYMEGSVAEYHGN